MAEELRAYARAGIGHVQLVIDPITRESIERFAPVLRDPRRWLTAATLGWDAEYIGQGAMACEHRASIGPIMRVSNHAARLAAGAVMATCSSTACGSPPPPSAPPTVRPTPVITPDPHLTEPATADQVFRAIRVGDLDLHVNNATAGGADAPLVKRINAAIGNWPLVISEYRSGAAAARGDEAGTRRSRRRRAIRRTRSSGSTSSIEFGPDHRRVRRPPDFDPPGAGRSDSSPSSTRSSGRSSSGPIVPVRDQDGIAARRHRRRRAASASAVTSARPRTSGRTGDEVSDLDKRIIEHLQQDGRRPFTQIAAELGVSEAAVRARTNRLVDRGILQVVGVTDPLKLGFQQMAMIGIRCEADRLMSVAAAVAEFPEVDYVVITAGTYDILIETVCEDNEGLLRFLAERLRTIDGVRDTETFVYLRMVKQSYQWGTR